MSQLEETQDLLNMGETGSESKEIESSFPKNESSSEKGAPINGSLSVAASTSGGGGGMFRKESGLHRSGGGVGQSSVLGQKLTVARHRIPGQLQEIMLWRNKYRSGLAFALGNLFFYFTTLGEMSVVTVFSMIVFWLVLLGACLVLLSRAIAYITSTSPVASTADTATTPGRHLITRESAGRLADSFTNTVNGLEDLLRNAVRCRDLQLTFKVLAGSYLVGKLGPLFLNMYMGWLVFLSVMTFPKVYEWKQSEIDELVKDLHPIIQSKLHEIETLVKNHISKALSQIPPKVNEYLDMIRAQLRALTGASDRARPGARAAFGSATGAMPSTSSDRFARMESKLPDTDKKDE
ncbi:hypothetical protein CCYA_CCYA16G4180 [Cyanidiococcus yangmingshanensis]|nr:hypothetical protein CCYA_CCYA16G4180 [Cyanidiococcus yangmingshanensis]